jgi:hypothetical protein
MDDTAGYRTRDAPYTDQSPTGATHDGELKRASKGGSYPVYLLRRLGQFVLVVFIGVNILLHHARHADRPCGTDHRRQHVV